MKQDHMQTVSYSLDYKIIYSWYHYLSDNLPNYHIWRIAFVYILIDCLFTVFMGFSKHEYLSGLPFPSPVDHVLSELSTMTCLSWVALHGMAHSLTELDKTVVHVINLVSFLWLWFSVCLPSDREG